MNTSKMMFFTIVIISTLIVINSSNWLSMWMGLEINLMTFIPMISENNNKKISQSMMIYFLIQSIGSMILMFSLLLSTFVSVSPTLSSNMMILNMSLLLKLGAAPFHNWLPEMFNNMNWYKMFMLMTWQKVAPIYMLSNMKLTMIIPLSIMLSSIIGAIGGLNLTSLRKIMAYSSINHLSWILFMMFNQTQWFKYLFIYSIMMLLMMIFLNKYNSFNINQLMSKMPSFTEKLTFSTMLLSMGGMPPFLGFLPKWMAIQSNINLLFMLMPMIMMSMITLFYYMRMISAMMLLYSATNKWFKTYNYNINYMYMNLLMPLLLIFSIN
uniref:NADH-ubiquinone oxidoreductase chain 2 n=1 Tax=Panaorus albomaculatus TaxID=300813 RepID=A0A1C9J9Y0_9HEMI|nr:NADH dehydrogenase subunit 2 [Panaorus albomaculatus]AOP18547.1 NADH dehydrogenase subunit 2 [Panaorus albomaculatus]